MIAPGPFRFCCCSSLGVLGALEMGESVTLGTAGKLKPGPLPSEPLGEGLAEPLRSSADGTLAMGYEEVTDKLTLQNSLADGSQNLGPLFLTADDTLPRSGAVGAGAGARI